MSPHFSTIVAAALALVASVPSASLPVPEPVLLAVQDGEQDEEPVRDGKWLYTRNCAGCHNDNGDGKGATILQLGLTARDFQQGGFAFGDTPEQLFKTITTGIPGRSPMPSFKGVLTDEEIGLVIEHVRTLMPKREDSGPRNTEMIVKDRPVIARGKLPPIAEGAPETIRGLLIGTPEGMTFQYDLADVKLLGVRIGRFADREDWGGRGGGYLKPLGQLVWSTDVPEVTVVQEGMESSNRILRGTWRFPQGATVAYEVRVDGRCLASVQEGVATTLLGAGPAMTRLWSFSLHEGARVLADGVEVHRQGGPPIRLERWIVRELGEPGIDATLLRIRADSGMDMVDAKATTVRVREWTAELAAQLEKELAK